MTAGGGALCAAPRRFLLEYDQFIPQRGGHGMKRLTWFVLLAVLALPAAAAAQGVEEKRYQIPVESSPSLGPADAPVTVFEFLDFQ
jgi:hypothetical protein